MVLVPFEGSKDNPIYRYKIPNIEFKENTTYEIHQYIEDTDENQSIFVKGEDEIVEKDSEVRFIFSKCSIKGKLNRTSVDKGLVPEIYFYIK
jgi:hypothetical protein